MYFESIVHKDKPYDDLGEACTAVFSRVHENDSLDYLHTYETPSWRSDGRKFFLVSDYLDRGFFETALIVQEANGNYFQLESFTVAWMKKDDVEKFCIDVAEAIKEPGCYRPAKLIFDKAKETDTANFICGCCGNNFTGNVKEQLEHDQDAGYGLCSKCS